MHILKISNREMIEKAKRIVVKVGTSTVTHENGRINFRNIERLTWSIASLMNQDKEVILVTSGAIGVGVGRLFLSRKPEAMRDKQAVAAVGQCELMSAYSRCMAENSYVAGQILLTKDDLDDEMTKVNISNTFEALLEKKILPIVNENDTVSTKEILHNGTFGDNDALSAYVALLVKADILVILSDIDGFYDGDPKKHTNAKRIPIVPEITENLLALAGGSGSARGTGGMMTKFSAMSLVIAAGIAGVIAKGKEPHVLENIMEGKDIGTFFVPE